METERDDDLDFYPFGPEHVPAPGTTDATQKAPAAVCGRGSLAA